ncbi:MAG: acylphosphatase [Bdellovibrionota bacterium]
MHSTRAHVWISGTVQGVGFRESTREQALKLGVQGWIRNLPDGRVEGVFEGAPAAVDGVLRFVRKGPSHAVVESLIINDEPVTGEFSSFTVLRGKP